MTKGNSVVAERFTKILGNKSFKYMTLVSKEVIIINLAHIVNKCNNTYDSTIKIKPVDVNSSTYIDFNKQRK